MPKNAQGQVTQSCLTLYNPMDCSLTGSSVHGIFQARVLEYESTLPFPSPGEECSNYCTISLISHTSKVMLKIFQARLWQYVNCELPDVQARFRKDRGTKDQIANICWIPKNRESSRKTSTSALLAMPKPLTVWITTNFGKFFKRWEYQAT